MNRRRLSDAQISRALREQLPAEPYPGLYERITTAVASTPQRRSIHSLFGVGAADVAARRRMLLLVAALLLALMLGSVAMVGALLEERLRDPTRDLSVQPPADMAGFARSAYEAMPSLPPLTLTALDDQASKRRIYVHSSGAIRIERFAAIEDAQPETYRIYAGTRMGELAIVDSERVWYEQADAISEDPRVFVYAELGAASFMASSSQPGCEVAISPGEEHVVPPASAWEYVGYEVVAGRLTHHLRCAGELWIDVETRLTMRSRGAAVGQDGRPLGDRVRTIEVTEIEFGETPAELFEFRPPPGVARISDEEYGCAMDPYCSASPRPLITPPPAPSQEAPSDVDELVDSTTDAVGSLPAFEAFIERSNTKYPGSHLRVFYDGSGRFRLEETTQVGSVWESTTISLAGDGYYYVSEAQPDGSTIWRSRSRGREGPVYPLSIWDSCADGWEHVGVDIVAGRPAHHVSCRESEIGEFWIDEETRLVVRTQSPGDEMSGTDVQEVTELRFVHQPAELFDLPEGIVPEE